MQKLYAVPPSQFVFTWLVIFITCYVGVRVWKSIIGGLFCKNTVYHITGLKNGMVEVHWNFNHYLTDD